MRMIVGQRKKNFKLKALNSQISHSYLQDEVTTMTENNEEKKNDELWTTFTDLGGKLKKDRE